MLQGGLRERQAIGIRLRGAAGAQGPLELGRVLDEGPLLRERALQDVYDTRSRRTLAPEALGRDIADEGGEP